MTYKLYVKMTNSALRKGYSDFTTDIPGDLDFIRFWCHRTYFRNPELRSRYYSVEIYDGKKHVGAVFPARDKNKKLYTAYSVGSSIRDIKTYRFDKDTGKLMGRA